MITPTAPRLFMRTLQMTVTGSSDVRDIVVRIGLPEPDPVPGGDFRVLVEIEGFDEPYSRHFHGVDELQALLAGCWIVPQILPALAPAGATLTWLGGEDLGFGTSSAPAP
ncbi:MAG: DUF6968 family protein [Byssovorax sp.]